MKTGNDAVSVSYTVAPCLVVTHTMYVENVWWHYMQFQCRNCLAARSITVYTAYLDVLHMFSPVTAICF